MIFFGSKGKTVPGQIIEGIECPNCENQKFLTFGIIRYFHLYWIPTFPTSRKAGVECTHCKRTLIGKEVPKDLGKIIKSEVFNKKNIAPMFSGTILIACLILFLAAAVSTNESQEFAYIEQPAVNDLYIVRLPEIFEDADPDFQYGLLKISRLDAGQAELQVSKTGYNRVKGVRKDIRKQRTADNSYFQEQPIYIDTAKLKEMKESGAIYAIERI
ncbi:hypothetical protein [Microbulbifer aggregans]|uniref:hypothetical protein n=1 Tax=Microbulbifer aggregans TaxID=1769779 RepID=UPI001CFE6240|nr:hypothetical protein [Microbulbifer aggregans]